MKKEEELLLAKALAFPCFCGSTKLSFLYGIIHGHGDCTFHNARIQCDKCGEHFGDLTGYGHPELKDELSVWRGWNAKLSKGGKLIDIYDIANIIREAWVKHGHDAWVSVAIDVVKELGLTIKQNKETLKTDYSVDTVEVEEAYKEAKDRYDAILNSLGQ